MSGIKTQSMLVVGIALLVIGNAGAEIVVAGWDHATNPYNGNFTDGVRAADIVAASIIAESAFSTNNTGVMLGDWTINRNGSIDETFGTFAGAVTNSPTQDEFGANTAIFIGAYVDFTLINAGSEDYDLAAFRFDAWRQHGSSPQPVASVLAGGGITAGNLVVPGLPDWGGAPPVGGADYSDVDISLAGLADHILGSGETVTIRIEMPDSADGTLIDNIAVTGKRILVRNLVIAGWDHAANPYAIITRPADHTATDITATVTMSTTVNTNDAKGDWSFGTHGSTDETFGIVFGAVTNDPGDINIGGNLALVAGVYMDYTLTNTGTTDYELSAFRFDAFRQWGDGDSEGQPETSVLPGGGLTAGNFGDTTVLHLNSFWRSPNPNGEDYQDVDILLAGLADHTLAAGESVTFRLLMPNAGSTWIDNIAVTIATDFPAPTLTITPDTISFDTVTQSTYALYSRTDLMPPSEWGMVTNFLGTGHTIDYPYNPGLEKEFFKLEAGSLY